MIYLKKGQTLFDNQGLIVCDPTGYYNDGDSVACAPFHMPDEPVYRYEAKFIAYGGMVYSINDEKNLIEEILKMDPNSLFGKDNKEVVIDKAVDQIVTVKPEEPTVPAPDTTPEVQTLTPPIEEVNLSTTTPPIIETVPVAETATSTTTTTTATSTATTTPVVEIPTPDFTSTTTPAIDLINASTTTPPMATDTIQTTAILTDTNF